MAEFCCKIQNVADTSKYFKIICVICDSFLIFAVEMKILRKVLMVMLLTMATGAAAQTDIGEGKSLREDSVGLGDNLLPTDSLLQQYDSTLWKRRFQPLSMTNPGYKLDTPSSLYDTRRGSWEVNTLQGGKLFTPWRGAAVIVSGGADSMPGLLDRESGALTLYQETGRWSFSASALADKYRMVGMGFLETRYGVGGTVSYWVNNAISLHAFGYYYPNSSLISPAVNPYLGTTNYGGYADIRFHKNFGMDAGVRRYLNPMTGKWVTDPIVSPYVKFNNGQKFGFDFGRLLKGLIWGNQDEMMPRGPVRMGPPQQRR